MQPAHDLHRPGSLFPVVVGNGRVQRPTALDDEIQRLHGLLQRGLRVHAMVVEHVHIVQPQPLQALVTAGHQVLPAAPVAVGAVPHVVARLRGDHQLVPVGPEVLPEDAARVDLGAAGDGAVVVGQVELGDAVVEGRAAHGPHVVVVAVGAEVVPEAQADRRELQPALPHAVILHGFVAPFVGPVHICDIRHGYCPPCDDS